MGQWSEREGGPISKMVDLEDAKRDLKSAELLLEMVLVVRKHGEEALTDEWAGLDGIDETIEAFLRRPKSPSNNKPVITNGV